MTSKEKIEYLEQSLKSMREALTRQAEVISNFSYKINRLTSETEDRMLKLEERVANLSNMIDEFIPRRHADNGK